MNKFVGRKQELEALNDTYNQRDALILINGARHIGKTNLVSFFAQDKPALHFVASEVSDDLNRRNFIELLTNYFNDELRSTNGLPSWEELFRLYAIRPEEKRKVLVIDNLDYLIQSNPNFTRTLATSWEKFLKPNNVLVIGLLSNNSVLSSLEKQKNALMNSLNLRIILQPVSFIEMLRDYPKVGYRELVSLYSIVGGVPKYWDFFKNSDKSILDQLKVVRKMILNPNGYFYNLPITLLEREVWEPMIYTSIFSYLAEGNNTLQQLSERTGFKTKELIQYLDNLELLGYIYKTVSINTRKFKPKKAKYFIKNNMFRFWFKFVFPFKSYLETNKEDIVLNYIKKEFPDFIQEPFRDISEEIFLAGLKQKALDFYVDKIGRFWNKNIEIPIVAIDNVNKQLFLADTSFTSADYSVADFTDFIESTWNIKEFNKYKDYRRIYGLFTADKPDEELISYVMNSPETIIFSGTTLYKQ